MSGPALLLGFLLLLFPQQAARTATVEGTVVRAGSSEPLVGVRVTLTKPPEPRTQQSAALERTAPPAPIPTATTDAQGKFLVKDVAPGTYQLAFAANGYVRQEFGQKIFPGQGTPIELAAGQAMKGVNVRMTSTAGISGRVTDSLRQPVVAVPVHLMRYTYDANGRRMLQSVIITQTDDRGEYRFYHLTPGRYYLAAGMLREAQPARAFNGVKESHPITYYPGVSDVGRAASIEVKPGAELNMDIPMMEQPMYRIRGKVVDARMKQSPTSVFVRLTTTDNSGSSSYAVNDESLTYNSADGSFEVRDVLPGSYRMSVTWGNSITLTNDAMVGLGFSALAGRAADPEAQRAQQTQTTAAFAVVREGIAYTSFAVTNADIENVTLALLPGGSVSGQLRVNNANAVPVQNMKVQLIPSFGGVLQGPVGVDGTFSFSSLRVGEYHVSVDAMPAGYYIKEARIGPADVLNRPLQFTADASNQDRLEIVLSPGTASVGGVATNERLEPVAGAQIVLVPERQPDRADLYKTVTTGVNGRFAISNIAPGDYKLWAWEALEPNAFFDLDLLKQVDSRAKSIHLAEAASPSADLRVIPAETPF